MAIPLKKYEQQVSATAETGTHQISGGIAKSMIESAGAENALFASIVESAGEIYEAVIDKKDENEIHKLNKNIEIDSLAFKSQIKNMTDPDEIQSFYNDFRKEQQKKFENSNLSRRRRPTAQITFNSYLDKMGLEAIKANSEAIIEESNNGYYDIIDSALNGNLIVNPQTGENFESLEKQNEYGNEGLYKNKKITYETKLKNVREFAQDAYYSDVKFNVKNNMEFFETPPEDGGYDETILNREQRQEVDQMIAEANQALETFQLSVQTTKFEELRALYDKGLLNLDAITRAKFSNEEKNGKQIPFITPQQARVLETLVTGRVTMEENTEEYGSIIKKINNLNTKKINLDDVDNILDSLVTINSKGQPVSNFSEQTTRNIINMLDDVLGNSSKVASGWFGWGTTALSANEQEVLGKINTAFETQIQNAEKFNIIGTGIARMDGLLESFHNDVIKGDMSAKEWEKANLTPYKIEMYTNMATMPAQAQSEIIIVDSVEEAKKLPSGTRFRIGKDGGLLMRK